MHANWWYSLASHGSMCDISLLRDQLGLAYLLLAFSQYHGEFKLLTIITV